jgi:PAS domain S-box-containing protein
VNTGVSITSIDSGLLFGAVEACIPIGLFLSDAEGNFTFTNDIFQDLGGFTFEQSLGIGWGNFVHPEDRDLITTLWLEASQAGLPFLRQIRFLPVADAVRHVVLRSAPIRADDGPLLGHIGTAEDISHRFWIEDDRDSLSPIERNADQFSTTAQARYEGLFDAAADAILVADGTGQLIDANRTATRLLGFSREELVRRRVSDIVARDSAWTDNQFAQFVNDGQWRGELGIRTMDGTITDMDIRATLVSMPTGDIYVAALREDSDRRRQEREQERLLRGLADASVKIASAHDLKDLLRTIVEQGRKILGAHQAVLYINATERWPRAQMVVSLSGKQEEWQGLGRDVTPLTFNEGDSTIYHFEGEPATREARLHLGEVAGSEWPKGRPISAPLIARDGENIGHLQLIDKEATDFDSADEIVLVQLAQLASASIESRRLYQETEVALLERDRALQLLEQRVAALAQVAAGLTFDHPLDTALQALATNVVRASGASAALVGLMRDGPPSFRVMGSAGLPKEFGEALEVAVARGGIACVIGAMRDRQLTIAENLPESIRADSRCAELHEFAVDLPWSSAACLPLIFRDRILGVLVCFFRPESGISREEARFIGAIGNQAAAAIETARLFMEAQGKAALEERQRLARDLHDSISQLLYGIGVGASAIRSWLDTDPREAIEPTEYILSLVRSGIAEMRSLIFELRPESLAQEGLVVALEKQATSLAARSGIQIQTILDKEPNAPIEYKEALFRVGQQALNNASKHARASKIEVRLTSPLNRIELRITDDGIGFDPRLQHPGHFGLQSMRERVERLNGTFDLKSGPGKGTRIRVVLPFPRRTDD